MIKKLPILIIFIALCNSLYSQQPPAKLPSLVTETKETQDEKPESLIKKNIYVKVFAGKHEVFTGEPILVTYKLYAAMFCRSRVSRQPAFNNCSVLELDPETEPEIEIIEGKKFHVYTIRKVQVTPLGAGILQLGAVEVENNVQLVMKDNSIRSFSVTSINEPVSVNVLPLPMAGRPENFSGVIGSFITSASADSNSLPAGENATLKITIKGTGNFAAIHAPVIAWPKGIEHFETSDTQHLNQYDYPVTGYKIFSIPFIGTKEGSVVISPASFNFFDPLLKAYRTITTDKVLMTFTKPITTKAQLADVKEAAGNSKYLWIIAAIAAVVVCSLLISMQLKSRRPPLPIKETITLAIADEPLQKNDAVEILALLNNLGTIEDTKKFLAEACIFLTTCLQQKFAAPGVASDTLIILLQADDQHTELVKMCSNIFIMCNRSLYSPDAEEGIKEQVYFELGAVIKKLYPA